MKNIEQAVLEHLATYGPTCAMSKLDTPEIMELCAQANVSSLRRFLVLRPHLFATANLHDPSAMTVSPRSSGGGYVGGGGGGVLLLLPFCAFVSLAHCRDTAPLLHLK